MTTTEHAIGFSPGERVPETGVYQVNHSSQHKGAIQTVFETGKKFPLCGTCFWSVRYRLIAQCTPQELTNLHGGNAKKAK